MAQQASAGLDASAIKRLAASVGDENIAGIMDQVIAAATQARNALAAAMDAGDFARAGELAHSVKSDCAYMGDLALVAELDAFEAGIRANSLRAPATAVRGLLAGLDRFLEAVRYARAAR